MLVSCQDADRILAYSEKGPLPEEVVAACAETWLKIKGNAKPSWQLT